MIKQTKLYKLLRNIYYFFIALGKIKIDLFSIKEYMVYLKGFQDLSPNNLKFYKNIFLSLRNKNGYDGYFFIDIGANNGWFIRLVNRFKKSPILAFEPLVSQHAELEDLAAKNEYLTLKKCAVGDTPNILEINEYFSTGLSSLKNINGYFDKKYDTNIKAKYKVDVVTLDSEIKLLNKNNSIKNKLVILKLDVQGFEYEVLMGASESFNNGVFDYVIIELTTLERYIGSKTYETFLHFFELHSYVIFDINCHSYNELNGKLLEFDVCFVKKDLA
jgi:FkbM family methyltransferase